VKLDAERKAAYCVTPTAVWLAQYTLCKERGNELTFSGMKYPLIIPPPGRIFRDSILGAGGYILSASWRQALRY
jgi:hypothetical protein